MAESWETVGRPAKKNATKQNGAGGSFGNKPFAEHAPSLGRNAPLKEEKGLFDALLPKEDRPKAPSKIPQPKKNHASNKKEAKATIEAVMGSVTAKEIADVLSKSQELFKGAPLNCLKEITGRLNGKLDHIPQPDPVFSKHSSSYPASTLSNDVRDIYMNAMKACSAEQLQTFIDSLIVHMLNDIGKGLSVTGYQIVAQILAQYKPGLFTINLKKYLDMVIANKASSSKSLTIMWVFGQCGEKEFRCGLKVWLGLMLPVLGIKALSSFSVAYLGDLLQKSAKHVETGYAAIELKDYFLLLDGVFSSNTSVQSQLQKRLREYYPLLKKLAYGRNPEKTVHKFFPSYLMRLSAECSKALKQEILECIVTCLSADSQQCLHTWTQMYAKHMVQSSIALNYLASNWKSKCSGIDATLMLDSLQQFSLTNEKKQNTNGLQESQAACQRLEELLMTSPTASSNSKSKIFVWLVIVSLGAMVAIDLYVSGGYEGSKSETVLKQTGIENRAIIGWTYIVKNFPDWVDTAIAYIGPVVVFVAEWVQATVIYMLDVTQPVRDWLIVNVPLFIDYVITHPFWDQLYEYIMQAWTVLQPYAYQTWNMCHSVYVQIEKYLVELLGSM